LRRGLRREGKKEEIRPKRKRKVNVKKKQKERS